MLHLQVVGDDYVSLNQTVHQLRSSHHQLANRIEELLLVHDQIKGQLGVPRLALT